MELANLITPRSVVVALRAANKAQLLKELATRASRATGLDPEAIQLALAEREHLGSTGVGAGIAIPHAQVAGLRSFFALFARLERKVDFASIDEAPVDLVFLLLIPVTSTDHVEALSCVARRLRDRAIAERLRGAATADEMFRLLTALPRTSS